MRPRLVIYRVHLARRNQRWRWRLLSDNGRKVANGGEGYSDRQQAQEAAVRVVSGAYGDAHVEWA